MPRALVISLDAGGVAKVLNLPAPTNPGDAVPKSYVDAMRSGMDWKESVRVASDGAINLAAPGANLDGVAMAADDRVLVKDQADAGDNGIYVWNGAAVPMTRAADANENAEVSAGLTVAVEEAGGTSDNTVWILATANPINVGVTDLTFTNIGQIVTASTGLVKVGNDIRIDVPVTIARGGTGAVNAADARTNLGATTKFAADIVGDNAATTFNVAHNLATTDVLVQVFDDATSDEVIADVHVTDANTVRIGFLVAPGNGVTYRVVVVG